MLRSKRYPATTTLLALIVTACGYNTPVEPTAGEQAVAVRVQSPERIQRPISVAASGSIEANETVDFGFQVAGV
jgi:hypothetical protein